MEQNLEEVFFCELFGSSLVFCICLPWVFMWCGLKINPSYFSHAAGSGHCAKLIDSLCGCD